MSAFRNTKDSKGSNGFGNGPLSSKYSQQSLRTQSMYSNNAVNIN